QELAHPAQIPLLPVEADGSPSHRPSAAPEGVEKDSLICAIIAVSVGGEFVNGFVDRSMGGVTELRVHGASGTSPESTLETPSVPQVSGDSTSGFYRRVWLDGPPPSALDYADVPECRRREAYSWGGPMSGAGSRALWLLLLPFMLANLAFWLYPAPLLRPDE